MMYKMFNEDGSYNQFFKIEERLYNLPQIMKMNFYSMTKDQLDSVWYDLINLETTSQRNKDWNRLRQINEIKDKILDAYEKLRPSFP